MDDLTFNYLLSADHYKKGDSWCQESIGEYDYWAIRWLYGSFSNADTPEKESAMLKNWYRRNQEIRFTCTGNDKTEELFTILDLCQEI